MKPAPSKARRNLRALVILGFVLGLVASIGGAVILIAGWQAPNVTQPLWQFGQYVMLLGLCNLFVYIGIFFQARRILTGLTDGHESA